MLLGGIVEDGFPMDLIRVFVKLAGGRDHSRIFLVPAATEEAERLTEKYRQAFLAGGCSDIRHGNFDTPESARSQDNIRLLEWATAVFFTGGDQIRLLQTLRDTPFARRLAEFLNADMPAGGSSAGAMALGNPVIVRGCPDEYMNPEAIQIEPGLDFLPGIIIDTHLTERRRMGRLINAIARFPGTLGIGLDENTGVLLNTDGTMNIYGRGAVAVLDARDWEGRSGDTETSGRESPTEPRLRVENVVLNIYKSGDRPGVLRMPVNANTR